MFFEPQQHGWTNSEKIEMFRSTVFFKTQKRLLPISEPKIKKKRQNIIQQEITWKILLKNLCKNDLF